MPPAAELTAAGRRAARRHCCWQLLTALHAFCCLDTFGFTGEEAYKEAGPLLPSEEEEEDVEEDDKEEAGAGSDSSRM